MRFDLQKPNIVWVWSHIFLCNPQLCNGKRLTCIGERLNDDTYSSYPSFSQSTPTTAPSSSFSITFFLPSSQFFFLSFNHPLTPQHHLPSLNAERRGAFGLDPKEILTSLASVLPRTIHQPCDKPGRGEIATQHFKLQALPSPLFTARLFLPTEAFAHKTKWVIQRERKSPRKWGTVPGQQWSFFHLYQDDYL